ncbi:MAG: hypothetical protein QNJ48_02840 [Desulfobacterales bacterium]|nr:hypothetical protein [Desulfobacterales bacterium]MDJ0883065.1 hypothetical protein [Desulfobacterales bacterium]
MKNAKDLRANIKNPNNDAYWKQRGYAKRPNDWKQLIGKKRIHLNRREKVPADGGITDFFWKDDY